MLLQLIIYLVRASLFCRRIRHFQSFDKLGNYLFSCGILQEANYLSNFLKFSNMKKLMLFYLFTILSLSLGAQEIWIESSLKGGYGVSFLHNSNIMNDDAYRYNIGKTYGFGAKLAVNFGPYNGLSIEGMYNNMQANFEYDLPVIGKQNNEISWKSVDAYLLYRYTRNRVFLELGPMYSFAKDFKQIDGETTYQNAGNFYEQNYLSGVFGWGGYLTGAETFSLGIGMRFHYALTDFVNDNGERQGYPNPVKTSNYADYKASHPAFVQLLLEFNFGIGRFAKAQCSKRMTFYRSRR